MYHLLGAWQCCCTRGSALCNCSSRCGLAADGMWLRHDKQTLYFSFTVYCVLRLLLLLLTYPILGDINLHPYSGAWVYGRQYFMHTSLSHYILVCFCQPDRVFMKEITVNITYNTQITKQLLALYV